jgi:hypothetical protein
LNLNLIAHAQPEFRWVIMMFSTRYSLYTRTYPPNTFEISNVDPHPLPKYQPNYRRCISLVQGIQIKTKVDSHQVTTFSVKVRHRLQLFPPHLSHSLSRPLTVKTNVKVFQVPPASTMPAIQGSSSSKTKLPANKQAHIHLQSYQGLLYCSSLGQSRSRTSFAPKSAASDLFHKTKKVHYVSYRKSTGTYAFSTIGAPT